MTAIDLAAGLIRQFERCRLQAYQDGGGVWTIGYGHTGPDVYQGLSWTQAQADAALASDLSIAAGGVSKLAPSPLADKQAAALISLAFNVGASALKGSGLIQAINAGQWAEAVRQWIRWDHDNGKEVKGLLRRRLIEAATYLEGTP